MARAPGKALGALMLDTALEIVGESPGLAIVVETFTGQGMVDYR